MTAQSRFENVIIERLLFLCQKFFYFLFLQKTKDPKLDEEFQISGNFMRIGLSLGIERGKNK